MNENTRPHCRIQRKQSILIMVLGKQPHSKLNHLFILATVWTASWMKHHNCFLSPVVHVENLGLCIQNTSVYHPHVEKETIFKTHFITKEKSPRSNQPKKTGVYWRAKWGCSPHKVPQRRHMEPHREGWSLVFFRPKGIAHKCQATSWVFTKMPPCFLPIDLYIKHREWRRCLWLRRSRNPVSGLWSCSLLWLPLISFYTLSLFSQMATS